jgi:Mpv17 / PMP22 family
MEPVLKRTTTVMVANLRSSRTTVPVCSLAGERNESDLFYLASTIDPADVERIPDVIFERWNNDTLTFSDCFSLHGDNSQSSLLMVFALLVLMVAFVSSKRQERLLKWSVASLCAVLLAQQSSADFMCAVRIAGAWYMKQLNVNPIIVKGLTAGSIAFTGDCVAQWVERTLARSAFGAQTTMRMLCQEHQQPTLRSISGTYSLRRGLSLMADGIFLTGPLMHLGYEVFERVLPIAENTASSTLASILHVVADTLVLDSFFVASTFVTTGVLEGIALSRLLKQFQADYFSSLKASWTTSIVMFPVQFCCFRYLPLSVRVLSVNCIDVVWDAVMSYMSHKSRH